ncbi:DUF3048 domain-containing protein [Patescibacteria group bacterium]|nr:DUF3048 domain-containing protein [Patescibacteria group bacterium]
MKKENKDILSWQYINQHTSWWGVVLFFAVAIFFSWWIYFTSISASIDMLGKYLSFSGSNSGLIIGAASAVGEKSDTSSRLIDGVITSNDKARLVPYAVMMENLLSVRPQSGLSQASVVYEALVEGGATRFMAIFDPSEEIPAIMPVRSARPYYIEWVSEYAGLYVHAGGSPKALTVLWENPDIHSLEALSSDGVYFWRDTSKYAPHNLVTSSEKMNYALRDKSLASKQSSYSPWLFKDEAPEAEREDNGKILSFNFSSGVTYKVDYAYHLGANAYARSNANQPHLDNNTGEQIMVKNVVVQLVENPALNGGKGRLDIYVGGTGDAWVLRDGEIIKATWQKDSRTSRTRFFHESGEEIEFNRGNTWVHVITKTQDVTYQ